MGKEDAASPRADLTRFAPCYKKLALAVLHIVLFCDLAWATACDSAGTASLDAFKHANAQQIEMEIRYDQKLRLRVRDEGMGIDAKFLNEDGRPGHFALRGMRERAKLLCGKLTVWSDLGSGTEVEYGIPAPGAYQESGPRRRSWMAVKFSRRDTEMKS